MNYNIFSYAVYLLLTLFMIFWVGSTLYRNGRPFVLMCLGGSITVADAVNKMLLAGYYLVNAGYAVLTLKIWGKVTSLIEVLQVLSFKIGLLVVLLGALHFINVSVLLWRRGRITEAHRQMIKEI